MLSRREFLRVSALAGAGTIVAACAQPAAPTEPAGGEPAPTTPPAAEPQQPTEPTAPGAVGARYNEAPQLAEMVAAGDLPPVEERLPLNPCVCPVMERTGTYGGTIRRGYKGVSDMTGPKMLSKFLILHPELALRPDMAERGRSAPTPPSSPSTSARMKWSDGEPSTSAVFMGGDADAERRDHLGRTGGPGSTGRHEQTTPDDYTVVYAR